MSRVTAGHGSTGWNPITALSNKMGRSAATMREGAANARMHSDRLEHEKWMKTADFAYGEAAADAQHSRIKDFHSSIDAHSGDGSNINLKYGDASASYTKKNSPTPETVKPKGGPVDVGMPTNIAKPKEDKPRPKTVARDPKTGRAMKAGTSQVQEDSTPKPETPAPVAGPSVGRDPKTGRATSIKKAATLQKVTGTKTKKK